MTPSARYTLGAALTLTGELDLAIAEQNRALEINPNLVELPWAKLGRYYAFSGEYDRAIGYFDRAIRTIPADPQMFLWLRHKAVAAFAAERLGEAVTFAKDAVACRADVSFNHYLLAAISPPMARSPRQRRPLRRRSACCRITR